MVGTPVRMPVHESVLQEKPPMVLEIGGALIKIGFATEAFPRFVLSIRKADWMAGSTEDSNVSQLYDSTVDLFSTIFFKCLLVSPKDRKIVVVENILSPAVIRENIAKVLFLHFEVSSLLFTSSHLVLLATLAIETALVVSIGHKESTVLPVYSGVQIVKAFQSQPYGGEAVETIIKQFLLDEGCLEENLTHEIIEDIKIRTCFVAAQGVPSQMNSDHLCRDIRYTLNGQDFINIPGALRRSVMEIFFSKDNENSGLPNVILESLICCPRDTRKSLATNIVLTGGMALIPGFVTRLRFEILTLLRTKPYKNELFIDSLYFHLHGSNPVYAQWLGGSIYGGTDIVPSKSISKESYLKMGKIPN